MALQNLTDCEVFIPKEEFLKELTEGSHWFECSLLLSLFHLVLETHFYNFSISGGICHFRILKYIYLNEEEVEGEDVED